MRACRLMERREQGGVVRGFTGDGVILLCSARRLRLRTRRSGRIVRRLTSFDG